MRLRAGAQHIIQRLTDAGYEAYAVGGCVRDSLLGREPHDWDITTSAQPDEIRAVFHGDKTYDVGARFGTVTVISSDDMPYEVTTFRTDGEYTDHRHPDGVTFSKHLCDDLERRDFTINAMAYNDSVGVVDHSGMGLSDLKNGVIRCVGDANDRFREDALRILRALRFASVYGFSIEDHTATAIHENARMLENIASERIQTELLKTLLGDGILNILLEYSDIFSLIVPELKPCVGFNQNNKYHQYTVYDHIAHAVANYRGGDPVTLMALLLHDIGKPLCYTEDENGGHFYGHGVPGSELAESALSRLKFDNESRHDITELVLHHDAVIEPTQRTVRRWLNKVGMEQFFRLMDMRLADIQAHADGTHEERIARRNAAVSLAWEIIRQNQCFTMKDLMVNGKDVMSFGVPEGKRVGEILRAALNAVIDGDIPNDRTVLLSFIRKEVS